MAYNIEQIEGIGQTFADKLRLDGITTTEDLLERGATPKGRAAISDATAISPKLILKWVNHADLFRIKGVAGQFAELLEAAGVDTVKELRHRVAANLHPRLVEVNDQRGLCNRVPSMAEVEKMITQAKELPPVVTY